jgi:hypothetical protein
MEVLKGRTFCGDNELQGAGIPVPFFSEQHVRLPQLIN